MSRFTALTPELYEYLIRNGSREDEVLAGVRERTAALGEIAVMQISPEQGAFLTLLARMLGARRAIELGTFTGYSAICIARGLSVGGRLIACELDPVRAEMAEANFAAAGVAERVEIRLGPALGTLRALAEAGGDPFDLVFVDADKGSNLDYHEACLELLRPGGVIVFDNVFMDGRVLDPAADEVARAVDQFNERIHADERVEIAMLAVADGITLARKRSLPRTRSGGGSGD